MDALNIEGGVNVTSVHAKLAIAFVVALDHLGNGFGYMLVVVMWSIPELM